MIVDAAYRSEGLPLRMHGNPLIEALPPMLPEREQAASMANRPAIDLAASRQQMPSLRMMDIDMLEELYVPPFVASRLTTCVDQLIRKSYSARSPLCAVATKKLYDVKSMLADQQVHRNTLAGAIFLEGMSGMGKTRLVRTVLGRMPQAIRHKPGGGFGINLTQVVWLSVDAPVGGSMQGLMTRMLMALDNALGYTGTKHAYATVEGRIPSVDAQIARFGQAAATHRLGMLHVDDFQRVAESQAGREKVLHFVMQLANVIGCPLIFSGTSETLRVLERMDEKDRASGKGNGFETARRICSAGHFLLPRPKSELDPEFDQLVRVLLRFQWLDKQLSNEKENISALYDMSCGVTSVLVYLHKQAQMWALKEGRNELALSDYYLAYKHDLRALRMPLSRLRKAGAKGDGEFEAAVQKMNKERGLAAVLKGELQGGDEAAGSQALAMA